MGTGLGGNEEACTVSQKGSSEIDMNIHIGQKWKPILREVKSLLTCTGNKCWNLIPNTALSDATFSLLNLTAGEEHT